MSYPFEERCADHEAALTVRLAAVRYALVQLDIATRECARHADRCPYGCDWDEIVPADWLGINPASIACRDAEASAQREYEAINEPQSSS